MKAVDGKALIDGLRKYLLDGIYSMLREYGESRIEFCEPVAYSPHPWEERYSHICNRAR